MPYWNALRRFGKQEQAIGLKQKHVRILQWHIEWAPDNVRARVLLACGYAALGDSANAIVELENALAYGAEDASTLFNAACTFGLLGRKAEALSTLKRAVQNGYWPLRFYRTRSRLHDPAR